jgi:uncharacterized protein YndB with AHSA1/START domain
MNPSETAHSADLAIVRVLDAPRPLVWEVWTDPKHATQWWGPEGYTTPVYQVDLRPGGAFRIHLRAPDGTIFPNFGTIEEVIAPERLVMFGAVEVEGRLLFESRTTIVFEERGKQTAVHVHLHFSKIEPDGLSARGGARQGWGEHFDRLEAYLLALRGGRTSS